jgi:transposase-like protein
MLQMSKKNSSAPTVEGTGAAVRQAARSSAPSPAGTSPAKSTRRRFTSEFKREVLRAVDAARASGEAGAVGAVLRRMGVYSSHVTQWERQRTSGGDLSSKKRGRKPSNTVLTDEIERLQRKVARLESDLKKAETVIDVQKKLAALLGKTLQEPTEEDFARPVAGLISRSRR